MARALTETEKERFAAIQEAGNIALVQTQFDGKDTAVIAAINQEDDGGYFVTPLAVLLTDEMFTRLTDPTTDDDANPDTED